MILATTHTLPEKKTVKTLGVVRGNAVRARHLGKDILALLRNIVGGEIQYVKLMGESREQAIDRMIEEAEDLGANAIVSVRFTTSMVMGGAAELLVYGTAVVVKFGKWVDCPQFPPKSVLPKDYARPALDKTRFGQLIHLVSNT